MEAHLSQQLGRKFRFKRHSTGEVEEWNLRLKSAFNADGAQLRDFTDEESEFILNEVSLSKWDWEYWACRYAVISSDQAKLTKFVPRTAQRKLLKKLAELEEAGHPLPVGKSALAVAKARRVGATVIGESIVAHSCMLRSQAKGLIASDIPENSLQLFQIQTRILDHLPPWMKPSTAGRVKSEHLYFDKLDSDITVGTGNQKSPLGQGIRLDAVHLTEAATWLPAGVEMIDEDIIPAFLSSSAPTTSFIIESTGKSSLEGDGVWFEDQCRMAKEEKGLFRLIFLSWYDVPEIHSMPAGGMEFNETTLSVADRIKRDVGYECTREQLSWYQIVRQQFEEKGNLSGFHREYPSTFEECWQYGLPCAWTVETLDKLTNQTVPPVAVYEVDTRKRKLINPHKWDADENPNLKTFIYEPPKAGFTYVVGCDAAYGQSEAGSTEDSAAVIVNRVGNRFAKDKVVAEFWGKIPPDELASVCWILGHMYTDRESGLPALMAIEANPGSPGLMTQAELVKWNYTNFYTWRVENSTTGGWTNRIGWYTTPSTRPLLTKKGVKAIQDEEFQIPSATIVAEMRHYVNYGAKYKRGVDAIEYFAHAPGKHDDRIMAAFIAFYVSHDYDRMNVADERRRFWEQKINLEEGIKRPRQFQDTDLTWEESMEMWEERLPF